MEHREWNLFTLTEQDFRELYLCLAWTQIEKGIDLQMKAESVSSEDQITNALYKDYSQFKRVLFADILKNNPYDGTQVSHLRTLSSSIITLNTQLQEKRNRFLRRLRENFEGVKVTAALQTFEELSFAAFVAELKKQKIKLSPMEQDQWEEYFDHYATACRELTGKIASTDREIDLCVYCLYGLTYEEVKTVDPDTTMTKDEYEQLS